MDGNRRPSFKKRPNPNFNKGGNKRGKFNDQNSESSQGSETVYRILCPSRKIGSVIGKGGGIIKVLREETQAKITVAESVPGSDERVVMVYSPSTMLPVKNDNNNNHENDDMELHCAAQDALLRVHDRIVDEDIKDGNDNMVVARLLVPNNTVGCLLGKKGDVIQRLRSETGASIRVMPTDQLPACAMSTDELVQISAKPDVAKGALYQVSTLLHQNPRKDKPPSRSQISGGQGLHRSGPTFENMPPMNLMQSERGPNARGAPSAPWMGGFGNEPSRFGPNGYGGDISAALIEETPTEFSIKLLCSAAKIGGVIGKGGSNVRQLQQDTGTNIHVDEASSESEERVIRVSSLEALTIPRSQTIDAVRFLQDKTSEHNEKGLITTRLLIPSSKVGCIIGQGGQVINEMRRRTKADIRVYSKEEKPKCAGEDEELVQVSGSYSVAKDALTEIASRYRARCLRDMQTGTEPAPASGYMPRGNLASEGPSPSGVIRGGRPGGYETFQGVGRHFEPRGYPAPPPREYEPHGYSAPPPREYEPHGYPVPPRASGYPGAVDMKMPNSGRGSGMGPGVHNTSEATETRLQDPYAVGAEPAAEMHGSQHLNASHGADVYQGYTGPGGQNRPPQAPYHDNYGTQQGPFPDMNPSHTSYNSTTTTTTSTHPPYPPQQGHYPESAYQYGH
uniref:KH domain-containing protein At4g18375-like n=1 Tax=Erigeron canadensis TaxID=72917 RepID=UPI001CB893F3|nr:KH domain-containing protein At4g18375-like [Erigeron canadensis]